MVKMKQAYLIILFCLSLPLLLISCASGPGGPPALDPTLSPPIIKKPIYTCAKVIAFSGADRDSKIIVYVNAIPVTEKKTWMGWGEIILPEALKKDDVISAAQVVENKISDQSRDMISVIDIPSNMRSGRKLNQPVIIPKLHRCQQLVRVKNVFEGVEVTVKNAKGLEWRGLTPHNVIRLYTDEISIEDDEWFIADQKICFDQPLQSDPSIRETVVETPYALKQATIVEPLSVGSDACVVENLTPGAQVTVFAKENGNLSDVGGGIALAPRTIFRVNPPINEKLKYDPVQSLCEIDSDSFEGIAPTNEVPIPTIVEPLCEGSKYITLCNTVALSTIKVYVDNGTQIARAAGNGSYVTMALGNNVVLKKGQKVYAVQFVNTNESSKSSPVPVEAGSLCEGWNGFVNQFRIELLKLINQYRAQESLNVLTLDTCRTAGAQAHTEWMRCKGYAYFYDDDKTKLNDSHGGPKCPGNCICDASNDYFVRFPKTSQELAKNTFEKWKNSPGHNENMLGDHSVTGIGVALGMSKSRHLYYITASFK